MFVYVFSLQLDRIQWILLMRCDPMSTSKLSYLQNSVLYHTGKALSVTWWTDVLKKIVLCTQIIWASSD